LARSITIEDLYQFKFLSRPRLSPDGRQVAFVVTGIDARKHAYRPSIRVAPADGGAAKQFIAGNSRSPAWSPDGRWLAFISDREGEEQGSGKEAKERGKGKMQVWLIPASGGEARQLTFMPHGAFHPVWSPDSTRLLFSAPVGPLDEEDEDGKPLPRARVIDRLAYRLDGVGYIYERRTHLFLIDIPTGENWQPADPVQLTDGDWDDKDAAWSPDGTQIAFASNRAEDRWQARSPDIYILSLENGQPGELRKMNDSAYTCSSPSWSPDGQMLAFLAAPRRRGAGHVELFTVPVDGSQPPRNLSAAFEGSLADWTNSDATDEHIMPAPTWSLDGQTLYVLANRRGASRIYAIPATGADGEPQTLTPGNFHAMDFNMDAARRTFAVLIESPTHLGEIFIGSTETPGELRQLTHCNDALFDELQLSTPEYFSYSGEDGWPIDAWLLKPPDFDPSRKYPLIVEIHGGPHSQYGYGFLHEMQLLAAAGYVVLFTNPRGSSGYGRDFALAVRGDWAGKDSLDILAGVDAVIAKGYIDEQRLGVIGGSYGGFMTSWLVGHSDRFRVAVADRSVINRYSFFGSSDIGWEFTDDDLEIPPWEDPERYMRTSPITYVNNIHTPLLIIHSESDFRCGIEQSEQLFAALKWLGRDVLFVRFEGQSHGLSRGGHPKLRKERLKHILAWFEGHMG
jgi:dipeptidyl aminopeptidase/acylaminoacyl peptidase